MPDRKSSLRPAGRAPGWLALILAGAVSAAANAENAGESAASPPAATTSTPESAPTSRHSSPVFAELQRKIVSGRATLAEVRRALTDEDIGALTNTVHALYSMHWHRGVFNLLHDLWALRRDGYPELPWRLFEKPPVRLALASTLLRIEPFDDAAYVGYLREHRDDAHEFHRAQVVIGLGFNASSSDVAYIREMARGDNAFVAQSAITALGLMQIEPAKQALIGMLGEKPADGRNVIVEGVLQRAYGWQAATNAQ